MNDTKMQAVMTALRLILVAIGGIIVKMGWTDEGTWELYVGAVMVVVPAGYEIWKAFRSEEKMQAREAVALNAGIVIADGTVGPTPPVPANEVKAAIEQVAPVAVPPPS